VIAAGHDGMFRKLCEVLEAMELLDDAHFVGVQERVHNADALGSDKGATLNFEGVRHGSPVLGRFLRYLHLIVRPNGLRARTCR
jgi:hypothetical protein